VRTIYDKFKKKKSEEIRETKRAANLKENLGESFEGSEGHKVCAGHAAVRSSHVAVPCVQSRRVQDQGYLSGMRS